MAKKMIKVSDKSGVSITEGQGAVVRVVYDDARRGVYELDVTASEADGIREGGRQVKRRGRKPATT